MTQRLDLLLFLFAVSTLCSAQSVSENELLGSYSLKRIDYIYADTTVVVDPSQSGFLVISPKRYAIAYNPGLSPRQAFADLSMPTDEEILAGFKTFAFNSGPYSYDGATLRAKPDFAKVPGFEGGEQVYEVQKSGGLFQFTMYDETYPGGEKPAWYNKLKIKLYLEKE